MNRSLFPTSVVTKAFTWAYQELGLNIKQASEILGISPSSLAQTTLLGFESGTSEYRKQLAFIRMYHLLISLSDGDSEQMKVWFSSYNITLGATPFEMCKAYDMQIANGRTMGEPSIEARLGAPKWENQWENQGRRPD